MTARTTTHLNFTGDARAALEHYRSVLGGELSIGTYGQGGRPQDSATSDTVTFVPVDADHPSADRVAFGLLVADGLRLAAYDVFEEAAGTGAEAPRGVAGRPPAGARRADGLSHRESLFVLLDLSSLEEARAVWDGLAAGGTVVQSLGATPWGAPYGMLTDRFGVTWIVGVDPS